MEYVECNENEATHVEILADENLQYNFCNVTVGKIYEILANDEKDFEGEEMIQTDNGDYLCSFSLVLEVKWLKVRS
jgi:hypothetical protein